MSDTDKIVSIGVIKRRIKALDDKRQKHLDAADALQAEMDALQGDLVQAVRLYAQEMGVQVSVRSPRDRGRKDTRCSICTSKGLSGDGHTAARHHVLVVRGEIPGDQE